MFIKNMAGLNILLSTTSLVKVTMVTKWSKFLDVFIVEHDLLIENFCAEETKKFFCQVFET